MSHLLPDFLLNLGCLEDRTFQDRPRIHCKHQFPYRDISNSKIVVTKLGLKTLKCNFFLLYKKHIIIIMKLKKRFKQVGKNRNSQEMSFK